MCLLPAATGLFGALGQTQAAGWLAGKSGLTAALQAASRKALLAKIGTGIMVGGTAHSAVQADKARTEAKREAKKQRMLGDAASVRAAQGEQKAKAYTKKRSVPRRSGLYV